MKPFLKSVVLFPVCLGLFLAVLRRLIEGWDHADAVIWALFLGLSVGVWFPFLLMPYLRRFANRT
ncbi:MAG: hypothetical protein JSW58_09430 [Candidatus Latescibacterota bacterium]|nr:MAG: hypothetical protein JSW58_09430 [Candidatus Latescibacterota bacterium]